MKPKVNGKLLRNDVLKWCGVSREGICRSGVVSPDSVISAFPKQAPPIIPEAGPNHVSEIFPSLLSVSTPHRLCNRNQRDEAIVLWR
jgi:hypothetical protein